MTPKICIIIPSHNLIAQLRRCLNSIKRTNYSNISVIVFDNGSSPPLIKFFAPIAKKFKKIVFLRSDKNLGFAKANNISIKYGQKRFPQTDYFLLLNNDAYVKGSFFDRVIPYLKQKSDLLSPIIKLTNSRGIDSMGIDYFSDGTAANRKMKRSSNFLLPAASLLVSKEFVRECFSKFGWFFVPVFGSYVEDVELSLRALLMEKKIFLINHNLVYHNQLSTFSNDDLILHLSLKNQLWTIIITWTDKMIKKNLLDIIKGQLINNVVYFLKYKNFFMFKIYWQTFIHLPQLLKLRKNVQKNLIIDYPSNIFVKNSITLKTHIVRSRTYRKLKYFIKNLVI